MKIFFYTLSKLTLHINVKSTVNDLKISNPMSVNVNKFIEYARNKKEFLHEKKYTMSIMKSIITILKK